VATSVDDCPILASADPRLKEANSLGKHEPFDSPQCHCEAFGCAQDKLREAICSCPNEIASGLRPSQRQSKDPGCLVAAWANEHYPLLAQ